MKEVKEFNIDSIELFSNYVLFKNPVINTIDTAKYAKLPKHAQEEFMMNNILASQPLFYDIEVLKVGSDCKLVAPGDYIFITMEIATQGTKIDNGNYILLRENQILGKNVGTEEDI